MKQSYEIVETRLLEERLGYERQLQQAERALKQKNASFNELLKLSQSAVKAKEAAERSLSKVQARDGKEISLSSDLQFDLEEPEAPLALIPKTQVDDPKQVRAIVSKIEEETGVGTMSEIVEKAERHEATSA